MPLSDIGIIVEKYINTSYDIVKTVYDNLATIRNVANYFLEQSSVVKAADESIASTVVLQDDDELFLSLAANTIYEIKGWIELDCASNTPNIKAHFTIPAGASWKGHFHYTNIGSGEIPANYYYDSDASVLPFNLDGSNPIKIEISLSVIMGSTAGNLTFQFAQQVSDVTALICKANSWLKAIKVS